MMRCICNKNCVVTQEKIGELVKQITEILAFTEEASLECSQIIPVSVLLGTACDLLEDMQEEPEEEEPPAELYGYLAHKLQHGHCDLTLKHTKEWLCANMPGHAADVLKWLEKHNVMCDCELLMNASRCD